MAVLLEGLVLLSLGDPEYGFGNAATLELLQSLLVLAQGKHFHTKRLQIQVTLGHYRGELERARVGERQDLGAEDH